MVGAALFVALLIGAGWACVRGSREEGDVGWARWALGAMLAGIVVHSLLYAALFEDPFTWVIAGAAVALAGTQVAPVAAPRPVTPEPVPVAMTAALRVLCLSNMWPGPRDPDFGAFVADMCAALRRRGLSVEPVGDRGARVGAGCARPRKYARLIARGGAEGGAAPT